MLKDRIIKVEHEMPLNGRVLVNYNNIPDGRLYVPYSINNEDDYIGIEKISHFGIGNISIPVFTSCSYITKEEILDRDMKIQEYLQKQIDEFEHQFINKCLRRLNKNKIAVCNFFNKHTEVREKYEFMSIEVIKNFGLVLYQIENESELRDIIC